MASPEFLLTASETSSPCLIFAPFASFSQSTLKSAKTHCLPCASCILFWRVLQQPSVIAEVISGILLGPTVMGRVPGFTSNIFPERAISIFTVIADLGLIFFMNLIGLELDFDVMVAEWKRTAIISISSMAIPFIVSIGSSYAVWDSIDREYSAGNQTFGTYLLFMYVEDLYGKTVGE